MTQSIWPLLAAQQFIHDDRWFMQRRLPESTCVGVLEARQLSAYRVEGV